jgi:hypothetical protein
MRLLINAPEALRRHVCVDLRRGKRGVPKQFLNDAKVGATLQEMGRGRVSKTVWAEIRCLWNEIESVVNDSTHRARIDPRSPGPDKHCRSGSRAEERGPAYS